jgi:serine/threonine protein kinase
MATFLPIDVFRNTYVPKNKAGSGSFGNVYLVNDGSTAVKTFYSKAEDVMEDILRSFTDELNFYQYLYHPNVCEMIAWTLEVDPFEASIAIPAGIELQVALTSSLLTWEELISQTLTGLEFLHSNGVAHADIKPHNILFFPDPSSPSKGLIKLIDFGLARQARLIKYSDDSVPRYYITNAAFSGFFQDPEYLIYDWNPIEVELYSVGYMLYYLFQRIAKLTIEPLLYTFRTGDSFIDSVIAICVSFPVKQRLSVRMVLDKLKIKPVEGVIRTTPTIPFQPNCEAWELSILDRAASFASKMNFSAQSMFLMLHIMHRSLRLIFQFQPVTNLIDLYILICYTLVENLHFKRHPSINEHLSSMNIVATKENRIMFLEGYRDVLVRLSGSVGGFNTYWEAAVNYLELPKLLADTITCDYNPREVRKFKAPTEVPSISKDVSSNIVVRKYLHLFEGVDQEERMEMLREKNNSKLIPFKIVPLYLENKLDRSKFVTDLTAMVQAPKSLKMNDVATILKNRTLLSSFGVSDLIALRRKLLTDPLGKQIIPLLRLK